MVNTVSSLVINRPPVSPDQTVEVISKLFTDDIDTQSVAVADTNKRPLGIVYRHQLAAIFMKPFGREIYGKRPVSDIMDRQPITVESNLPLQTAGQYVTSHMHPSIIQDFLIIENGFYRGIGTLFNMLKNITALQIQQLKDENNRLTTELDVARHLQTMLLPRAIELGCCPDLDIASHSEAAASVGGDYHDVLQFGEHLYLGIGDVTGHGLDSGILMLMAQTAVKTLLAAQEYIPDHFFPTLNRILYENVERMQLDKTMSLALLHYHRGLISISGQHELILKVRDNGQVEAIDTDELGFPLALVNDIHHLVHEVRTTLKPQEGLVLYSDGIIEALNDQQQLYGTSRLCRLTERYWSEHSAASVCEAIIKDFRHYTNDQPLLDDITLLVVKRRAA